ncbi:MAG: hypothetical protein JSU72_07415 [Deltaproteobacteria bacterium]|nr:MAG: hypothetical protein JSU72_07415 [Deltaproteobacteria bacterium]
MEEKLGMILVRSLLFSLCLILLNASLAIGNSLPQSIGSLRLEQILVGEEARQEINALHGKELGYRNGYVGTYGGGTRKAKVWVSEYGAEVEAVEANKKMAEKIQAMEGRAFWHFQEISINSVPVYFVVGQGQAHYFFRKGKRVIWLAVDPPEARKSIRDLLGQIP